VSCEIIKHSSQQKSFLHVEKCYTFFSGAFRQGQGTRLNFEHEREKKKKKVVDKQYFAMIILVSVTS